MLRTSALFLQYAIITTIDRLENVYVKGGIEANDYESACRKLLAQFKTLSRSLVALVPDPMEFMNQYQMHCPGAREVIPPLSFTFHPDQRSP